MRYVVVLLATLIATAVSGQTPYFATPAAIPGVVEAENFDRGGEGVAYHDAVRGNSGGKYRSGEDVDIITATDALGGGYVINNFQTGEWLLYTVSVPAGGAYDLELRASSKSTDSAFHVEVDGANVSGSVAVPNTGNWNAFQWVGKTRIALAAGTHRLKIVADRQYFNLNSIRLSAAPAPTPYAGAAISLPGSFEAENFDRGGEGVGYHDAVKGNTGGQYRTAEDVDIIASSDSLGGGYVVNNFETGEWLLFSVIVAAAAVYDVDLRVASAFSDSAFHLEVDGVDVTGSVAVPNTGSWSSFQWAARKGVPLAAGSHQLKIFADRQYFNLNSVRVTPSADTQAPGAPANLAASAVSASRIDLSWSAAADNVGATGYYVYRNGVQVASLAATSYSNTGLASATTYSYTVAAYDAAGNVSPQSGAASATTPALQEPYSGAPIAVPGVFDAVNFDRGGEGLAYHDLVAGNAGGLYRTSEDVDIILSTDSVGGPYTVNNFETGEWLAYTIQVPAAGAYDLALRVSSTFQGSAFHVELDGVDLTGSVAVPNTGDWGSFQWVGKNAVVLPAGTHVLKVVAEQQYFNLNQINLAEAGSGGGGGGTPPPAPATLLFRSGYEGATALLPILSADCWGTGCWQGITGIDTTTGFTWPPRVQGGGSRFQVLANTSVSPATVLNYIQNQIQTVTGPKGNPTRAMYSQITQRGGGATQDPYMIQPGSDVRELYISQWIKFQPDFVDKLNAGDPWRDVFEWKTYAPGADTDYRVELAVVNWSRGSSPQWQMRGDGWVPSYQTFWQINNTSVPVPVGQWFKLEVYWKRSSGSDGRVWMAVNGQVLGDRRGPNMGPANAPINRIMMNQLYTGGGLPAYQWADDVQIWSTFPTATSADAWYDPPYAPR